MVLLSGAALLLSGCGDAIESKAQADLSSVTLILGDQAKGLRTVVEAANALEGIAYKVQWANFQGAAPLFEALRAGAVDLGPTGDTPVLAAATGGTPLRIVVVRRSQSRGIAILVPHDSPIHSVADLARQNPDEYARVFAKANDVSLDVSQRLRSWGDESLLPIEARDVQTLQQVDDLFVEKKIFPHRVDVEKFTDAQVFSSQ